MTRFGLILIILWLSLALASCGVSASPDLFLGAESVRPEFRGVRQNLENETSVPVVLPTEIPGMETFYSSVYEAGLEHYSISLDASEDCKGSYCSLGMIGGEQLNSGSESVEDIYAFHLDPTYQPVKRSTEQLGTVVLANGIEGYFVPWVCGSNCDTAKVFWEQKGIRYWVGVEMGNKDWVVAIANSAIENEFKDNDN